MTILTIALAMLAGYLGLVLLVRRNLRQRPLARHLRDIFIGEANDLVGKAEFPTGHAKQLVVAASLPEGWLARYMAMMVIRRLVFGGPNRERQNPLDVRGVPENLRAKYVTALLALVLSDSYRSAIMGTIVRRSYSWIEEAVKEVRPDVNAHATRNILEQVTAAPAPHAGRLNRELLEVC